MAAVILSIIGLWFIGSLIVCLGLCRAASQADQKLEQHRLAANLGVKEPGRSSLDIPSRPVQLYNSARQPVR